MKSFALALTAGAVSALSNIEIKYMHYLAKWGKQYDTVQDFMERLSYFAQAELEIQETNAAQRSYILAHNHMSDWSEEEF